MTTTTGLDPHAALREATASRHERLDTALRLAAPGSGYEDYVAYLAALLDWMQAVEPAILQRPWPAVLQAERRAGKSARILADLHAARGAGVAVPCATPCSDLPDMHGDDAYALGVLYVIEGSQLGGRYMVKRYAQSYPDRMFAYLSGYGDETGPLWKSFLQCVQEQLTLSAQVEQAVRGACDAFDTLGRRLAARGQLVEGSAWD